MDGKWKHTVVQEPVLTNAWKGVGRNVREGAKSSLMKKSLVAKLRPEHLWQRDMWTWWAAFHICRCI